MKDEKAEKIYTTIRLTNSISVSHSGKVFEFGFTKKQYYLYLMQTIAWVRILKTVLIITGIIGFFLFKPLFIGCGVICLVLDVYAFLVKKINWYFIFIYPVGYLAVMSLYGIIYASFLVGILNLLLRLSFFKMPYEVRIDKIQAQDKKVFRIDK